MHRESLALELGEVEQSKVLLLRAGQSTSAAQLLEHAQGLRARWALEPHDVVAVTAMDPAAFVGAVVALDGAVAAMLLLPAGTAEDVQRELMELSHCTTLIDGNLRCTRLSASNKQRTSTTRWILSTSGTTGKPKLIEHTLASLTRTVRRDRTMGEALTWGLVYDPARFAGLQVVLQSLLGGSRLAVAEGNAFESQVETLVTHRVNALSATPSLWRKLMMDGRILGLPLRQITIGGEIADQPLLDSLSAQFPSARVVHIYASTEAGTGFTVHDRRAGFPAAWLAGGVPVPMRVDEGGHLWLRPDVQASGAEISRRRAPDGFLDTEDVVRVDGDRVYFVGRASGAVNVGGNKVHPEEIEAAIRKVDGVRDVRVFARSSSMMGQLVVAEVVPESGLDKAALKHAIQAACRANLEPWQRPASIQFTDALAETSAGKRVRIST